jgi:DNA-binding IclR family transcriptional regulator
MTTGVQSVRRAVALLGEVAFRPAGLVELATAVDLPVSTTARLLGTLVDVDALHRLDDGSYRIGPAVAALGSVADAAPSLRGVAQPLLEDLNHRLDEAIGLSVHAGDDLVTIAQVDVPRPVQAESWEGSRWPLHQGGSGLALMATWDLDEVDAYAALHPAVGEVHRRIEEGRQGGVWWTTGGYVDGLTSAAAAIVGRRGRAIGAVYAYGPSYRFPDPDRVQEIESTLVEGAARIARAWAASTAPLPTSLALAESPA